MAGVSGTNEGGSVSVSLDQDPQDFQTRKITAKPLDHQEDYAKMRDSGYLDRYVSTYYKPVKSLIELAAYLGKEVDKIDQTDLARIGFNNFDELSNQFSREAPVFLPIRDFERARAELMQDAAALDEGVLVSFAASDDEIQVLENDYSQFLYDTKKNDMFRPGEAKTTKVKEGYSERVSGYVKSDYGRVEFERKSKPDSDDQILSFAVVELPWVTVEDLGETISWQVYGKPGAVRKLTRPTIGSVVFDKLKDYLKDGDHKHKTSKGATLQAYYARQMSKYFKLRDLVADRPDNQELPLNLKGFLVGLPQGYAGETEAANDFGPAMVEIARRGWFREAIDIDFANATVTFKDKKTALDVLERIYKGVDSGFHDPATASMDMYLGLTKTAREKEHGVPIIESHSMRGAYEMLRGGASIEKKDYTDVRRQRFYNGEIITSPMQFGDWEDEADYLKDSGVSADNFRYYMLVKNEKGIVEPVEIKGASGDVNPMTGAQGPSYVKDYDLVTKADVGTFEIPDASDLQGYLDGFGAVNYLNDIMIHNDTNCFFITDTGVPIIRAPRFYERFTTSQYGIANKDEFASPEVKNGDAAAEQAYFTFDESMMIADFFNGILGDKEPWMYYDDRFPASTVVNPVTSETEEACVHRLNLPTEKMREMIAAIDAQLLAGEDAYPKDYWTADEGNLKYWFSKTYELKFWSNLDGEAEYDPEQAWKDPVGRDDLFVTVGRYTLSRKRAAYLANVFRLAIMDKPNSGLNSTKMQEVAMKMQENLSVKMNRDSMWSMLLIFGLASPVFATIITLPINYWVSKKLQKELMAEGVGEDRAKELAKKLRKGPPDFLRPLVKSVKDIQPYEATPEREQKIKQIMQAIAKSQPILLLGESAQGKSLILEEIQRRLLLPKAEAIAADVPPQLAGRKVTILYLDADMMESGTKYVGQFAEKMAQFKVYMARHPDAVVFADEWHKFIGLGEAGESKGSGINDFPNKIKEDLARKRMRFVAATTLAEYQMHFIDKRYDASRALERRFKKISLDTYTPEQVKSMLKNLVPRLLEKYSILRIGETEGEGANLRNDVIDRLVDRVDRTLPPERKNELMVKSIEFIQDLADRIMREYLGMDLNSTPDNMLTDDPEILRNLTMREPLVQRLSVVEARLRELSAAGIMSRLKNKFEIGRLEKEKEELKNKIEGYDSELMSLGGDPRLIPVYEKRLDILQKSLKSIQDVLDAANVTRFARDGALQKLAALERDYDTVLQQRSEKKLRLQRIIDGMELPAPSNPEAEKTALHAEIGELSQRALDLKTDIQLLALRTGKDKLSKSYKEELGREVEDLKKTIEETERQLGRLRTAQVTMRSGGGYRGVTINDKVIERFWSDIMSGGSAALDGAEVVARKDAYTKNSETVEKIIKRIGIFNQNLQPTKGQPGDSYLGYRMLGLMDYLDAKTDSSNDIEVKKELERILRDRLLPMRGELNGIYANRLDYILKQVDGLPNVPDQDAVDKIRQELTTAQLYPDRPELYSDDQLSALRDEVKRLVFPRDANRSAERVKDHLLRMYEPASPGDKYDLIQFVQRLHDIYTLGTGETTVERRDRTDRTNALCQQYMATMDGLSTSDDIDKVVGDARQTLFEGLVTESDKARGLIGRSSPPPPAPRETPKGFKIDITDPAPTSFSTAEEYRDYIKQHLIEYFDGARAMLDAAITLEDVVEIQLKRLGNPVVGEGDSAKANPNFDRAYSLIYSEWQALDELEARPEFSELDPQDWERIKLTLFMEDHLRVQEIRAGGAAYSGPKTLVSVQDVVQRILDRQQDAARRRDMFERAGVILKREEGRRAAERSRAREKRK